MAKMGKIGHQKLIHRDTLPLLIAFVVFFGGLLLITFFGTRAIITIGLNAELQNYLNISEREYRSGRFQEDIDKAMTEAAEYVGKWRWQVTTEDFREFRKKKGNKEQIGADNQPKPPPVVSPSPPPPSTIDGNRKRIVRIIPASEIWWEYDKLRGEDR